jgi:16S rRNA (cytosine967-C5)-methyltransferase
MLVADNTAAKVSIAALPGFSSVNDLTEFGNPGIASPIAIELAVTPSTVPEIQSGLARVQDQGSQLVALALLARGKKSGAWLDMCSGPGGKSAVLQAGIRDFGGTLDCLEPNPQRADLVRGALDPDGPGEVIVAYGQDAEPNSYDAILLDAPCSGLGSVRRKPESRWRKKPEQLPGLVKLQAELLDAAATALRSGGVLVYSTCSPLIPETNAQIQAVMDRHPDLRLENANEILAGLSPSLELNTGRKTAQLWTHLHGTDAMFISVLSKA